MRPFRAIVQHFDPIWSPDGRWLIYLVWKDGRVWFELLDHTSETARRLEPMSDYVAARPVWSRDSRYVGFASLREVKIIEANTGVTRTIQPAKISQGGRTEISLMFDRRGCLNVSFDTNALGGWEIFAYLPTQNKLQHLATEAPPPAWARRTSIFDELARHTSLRPRRSPSGKHVAVIKLTNGLRRIEVQPTR